jgi:hypothetical protein
MAPDGGNDGDAGWAGKIIDQSQQCAGDKDQSDIDDRQPVGPGHGVADGGFNAFTGLLQPDNGASALRKCLNGFFQFVFFCFCSLLSRPIVSKELLFFRKAMKVCVKRQQKFSLLGAILGFNQPSAQAQHARVSGSILKETAILPWGAINQVISIAPRAQ